MILPPKEFWKPFKETIGAFSTPEAITLYEIALNAPKGWCLELGSHKGKSSQVIALALNENHELVLVEPEFVNQEWEDDVIAKVQRVNPKLRLEVNADYSTNVIPSFDELSFVFIDSGVHDDLVMEEVKLLEDKIIKDGIVAFHDYLNQFTAVERAYNYLLSTNKFERIEIDWKNIFDYVRENNLEEGNVSWHEKGSEEFPKFVGAVKRK